MILFFPVKYRIDFKSSFGLKKLLGGKLLVVDDIEEE